MIHNAKELIEQARAYMAPNGMFFLDELVKSIDYAKEQVDIIERLKTIELYGSITARHKIAHIYIVKSKKFSWRKMKWEYEFDSASKPSVMSHIPRVGSKVILDGKELTGTFKVVQEGMYWFQSTGPDNTFDSQLSFIRLYLEELK